MFLYFVVRKKFRLGREASGDMPKYFYSSVYTTLQDSVQFADNIPSGIVTVPETAPTGTTTTGTNPSCCCPSTTTFLSTLVDKLYLMATTLKGQFEAYEAKTSKQNYRGVIIAEIDTSSLVGIKYEYVIYVERYGPPIEGIFDEALLEQIRKEMATTT
jgi:hypothetical protein